MPLKQRMVAVIIAASLVIFIIEIVRRRKLREEYSWLWIMVGSVIMVLALWPTLLLNLTHGLGIQLPVNTVFFFGLIFMVFINLHFSVKISELTDQVKRLTQELALREEKPPDKE